MNNEFIEDIVNELSYRLVGGLPDLKNEDHLYILREIMAERGLPYNTIQTVMDNLRGKRLLTELEAFSTSPKSLAVDFDGAHSTSSIDFSFKSPETKIEEPIQDDEAEDEDDGDEPVKEESYVPSYIFDADKMGIVETGNTIPKSDVLSENKFKCFMTGEVFLETKNGTLVKELDYLDSDIEDEDNINEDDIVKKKETGNVYTVKNYNPERGQSLVKKDASPEEIEKVKDGEGGDKSNDKQKVALRKKDHEETDKALHFTEQEYEKEKEQIKSGEIKGRGLGTGKSRAGEAATHYAIRALQEGKSLDEIKNYLMDITKQKGTFLDKNWVNGALNATKLIVNKYGIDNIKEVTWDTPDGRKLIDVEGHGTPSDMFITTKDGKRVGISLKQNGRVFISNLGYNESLNELLTGFDDKEKQQIQETAGIETYKKDRDSHVDKTIKLLNGEMKGDFEKSLKYFKSNPDEAKRVFKANYKKYLNILGDFDSIVKKVKFGEDLKNDEIKAIAKIIGRGTPIYQKTPELYDNINLADNRLVGRLLKVFEDNPKFAHTMKKSIVDKIHIKEILDLEQNKKLDDFVTVYGEPPDGVELSKNSLLELFGKKTEGLYEIREVFKQAKTPEEKKKASAAVMKNIYNSIYVDFKDGARTGEIKIKHEDGKEYPIFTIATRARGIGAAPALEMYQADYLVSALKNKTFDINGWSGFEKKKFLTKLKAEYEEKLKDNAGNPEGIKELQDGINKIDEKLKGE